MFLEDSSVPNLSFLQGTEGEKNNVLETWVGFFQDSSEDQGTRN